MWVSVVSAEGRVDVESYYLAGIRESPMFWESEQAEGGAMNLMGVEELG